MRSLLQFQAMTSSLIAIGFGFYYCWQLSLILLGIMPLAAAGMGAAMAAGGWVVEAQDHAATATAVATEAIAGYRTVATFQMEDKVTQMFDEEMQSSTSKSIRSMFVSAGLYGVLGMGLMMMTNAIAFGYGGYAVTEGIYTADEVRQTNGGPAARLTWIADADHEVLPPHTGALPL